MLKAAFKKKALFTRKFYLNLGGGGGAIKLLHWEHSFTWCWKLDASESRSDIPGNSGNVVVEKFAGGQLDRPSEKWEELHGVEEERNIV